jgi:hypothetical protein
MTAFTLLSATTAKTPKAPPVTALADHAQHCRHCRECVAAGLPWRFMCPAGALLCRCAMRARARRAR